MLEFNKVEHDFHVVRDAIGGQKVRQESLSTRLLLFFCDEVEDFFVSVHAFEQGEILCDFHHAC